MVNTIGIVRPAVGMGVNCIHAAVDTNEMTHNNAERKRVFMIMIRFFLTYGYD